MDHDQATRERLVTLMKGGEAFIPVNEVLVSTPFEVVGQKPGDIPFSIWQLTEHMRIALYDILEFSKDPYFESPQWPDEYWPATEQPDNANAWKKSIRIFQEHLEEMILLVREPWNDLYKPFLPGKDYNLLRQAQLVAEHNAYHTGQIVLIRKLLGAWK